MMRLTLPKLESRHRHLIAYIKENRLRLFLAMVCMLVVAASQAVSAWLIQPVLDDVFVEKNSQALRLIPFAVMGIFFLRGLGMYGQQFLMEAVGQRIIRNLRNDLYDHYRICPSPSSTKSGPGFSCPGLPTMSILSRRWSLLR